MIEKFNYRYNKKLPLAEELINGQGCGEVSHFKYGLFHMSYNGCEIIATYNLLRLIGRPAPLAEIANEIYPYGSVIMGLFGTNPYMIGKYLKKHNVKVKKYSDYNEFVGEFEKSSYCILSFWTGTNFLSSLHTIALENKDGKIIVYNRFNSKDFTYEFDHVQDFLKRKKFIMAYIYK